MSNPELHSNIKIQKVAIKEIETFMGSELFSNLDIKPLSPHRAKSYINNPRCHPDDIVVYMLFDNEKMACFRTILPDWIETDNEKHKFGWLSGNYTRPTYRRKGYSKQLLDEIYKDYHGKLMYTNYAMESHYLYTDSGKFSCIKERVGFRYYGSINLADFLKHKKNKLPYKLVIPIANLVINFGMKIKRTFYKQDKSVEIITHSNQPPDDLAYNLNNQHNTIKRGHPEINWITKFPWLTTNQDFKNYSYPFSFYTDSFNHHFLSVKKKEKYAHIMLLERDQHIKLSYTNHENIIPASKAILDLCYRSKAKTLTILDEKLNKAINSLNKPFIYKKPFKMSIYATFSIEGIEDYSFQDGDGDNVFT
jgi:hypothetical protein